MHSLAFIFSITLTVFMSDNYTLLQRKYWIFDLDGTLTVAVHDFNAIRNELGIPAGQPILKTIESLPENESLALQQKLQDIEENLARKRQTGTRCKKFTGSTPSQELSFGHTHLKLQGECMAHAGGSRFGRLLQRRFSYWTLVCRAETFPKGDSQAAESLEG